MTYGGFCEDECNCLLRYWIAALSLCVNLHKEKCYVLAAMPEARVCSGTAVPLVRTSSTD